jgi:hypothetical protein
MEIQIGEIDGEAHRTQQKQAEDQQNENEGLPALTPTPPASRRLSPGNRKPLS